MIRKLAARLPARYARFAMPIAILAVALVVFAGLAVAALVSPSTIGISAARISETKGLPDTLLSAGLNEKDADRDGLSDSLENYLYGTDPLDWDSSGTGIPDGWYVQFRFDPLSPLAPTARGASPPPEKLPAAYDDGYPIEYTPLLADYYSYGRPESYQPGIDAPWWRDAAHADPSQWDQSGTGVPTGWLLHYGLDPQRAEPDRVVTGAKGNLTLLEAFTHNTDPHAADSDLDGLTDWDEINIHKTDPADFDTSGSSVADGWLIHYGLNPFDRSVGSQDVDLDGLTNLEEFILSREAFLDEVEADGLAILFGKGLDPLDWQTGRTGIPDGWYVKYGLSPFGGDVDRVIGRASEWSEVRDIEGAPEGKQPLADFAMTIRDAYDYGRPDDWNESTRGVWWGGTDPQTGDSDDDGMPDVIEIRGWYANVTADVGPEAKPRAYAATSNPLEADSDGDGLNDLEEYRGRTACGAAAGAESRAFPITDPRARDTAFSGLTDLEKVCGAVRGTNRYDLRNATLSGVGALDPTRADSAGDYMRDGARLDAWHKSYAGYLSNPRYPYNGSAYKTVYEWTEKYGRFGGLAQDQVLAQFRPDGDIDDDAIPNVLDADPSGGLYVDKFATPGTPRTKVFSLGGPEVDPELYRYTAYASPVPHTATDPANPDTDGDGLPDAWELRYGVFDAAAGRWNLDPARSDSDGDGIDDAQANNDADVVTWYSYMRRGDSLERVTNTFAFDNLLEFAAETNPNEESSQNDGVPDGWKAFWGSRVSDDTWPNLFAARDPRIGDLANERSSEIETAMGTSPLSTTANLKGAGSKSTGYVRIVNVSTCDVGSETIKSLLKPDEQFRTGNPCYAGQNLEGNDMRVVIIEGVSRMTYRREAEVRTNPFLADSDGDGAPDAYESYFLIRSPGGTAFPDPALYDADKDPDKDGIGLSDECKSADGGLTCGFHVFQLEDEEYGAGADPNNGDTDADGIQDGIEFNAGIDALDPSDIEYFRRPDIDTDQDGVPDYQELTGWGKGEFGVTVRTDPKLVDTDGDGALDGANVGLTYKRGATAASDLATNARIESWCARGYAHRTLRADGSAATSLDNVCGAGMASRVTTDLLVSFYGERTYGASFGFRPDVADSGAASQAPGIPDGWLAYYNENPKEKTIEAAAYAASKPSWWVEDAHGVWWWGRPPGASQADDLDADGLHDRSGEDPFPTLRRDNLTWNALVVADPRGLQAFVSAGATAEERLLRAQRLGDGAGDPAFARASSAAATDVNGIPTRLDRARVAILDFALPDGATLTKGVGFNVTGRVVLDERNAGGALLEGSEGSRIGVRNRTVVVGAFSPDRGIVLGVGYTDAVGAFRVFANITPQLRVDVPQGLYTLGAVNGTLVRAMDPAALSTGTTTLGEPNRIVAWVTNTSATAPPASPTYGNHLARPEGSSGTVTVHATRFAVTEGLPVAIRSDTTFSTTVGGDIENGRSLVGDLKLQDATGAPLTDKRITLRWTGIEPALELLNLSTDRSGIVNVTNLGLVASVAKSDQYALIARFDSAEEFLRDGQSAFPVSVRSPTVLLATLDRAGATVGESVVVDGRLLARSVRLASGGETPEASVAGATVRVALGGSEETVRTDDNGAFNARIPVPGSLAAGATNVILRFDGTATEAPTEKVIPIAIKRTASIRDLNRLEGPRSIEATLRGKLVDNEGQGFAGEVALESGAFRVAATRSKDSGEFALVVPLGRLPLGPQVLKVAFPGDAGHAAAENFTQARITSTTTLKLDGVPPTIVRGETFRVRVTLVDDAGDAVPGVPVSVSWRGERVALLVTDATGLVVADVTTNVSERPAVAELGAGSIPQPTSVYQPSTVGAAVRVFQGTTLLFDERSVHRGPVSFSGRLLDDQGRPLIAASVTIEMGGGKLGEARTGRNGTFQLDRTLPEDGPLGPVRVVARYAGTPTLAEAENDTTWHVRSALTPRFTTLGPFVRGEGAPLEGQLVDDRGKGVDTTLRVTLGERELGAVRVVGGSLRGSLFVPADMPRGSATLLLRANATDQYDAFERSFPAVVKIRPEVDVRLPALAVRGFAFSGALTLKDDKGEPLANTTFVYTLGKGNGVILGQTDAKGEATLASVAPLSGDTALSLTVRGGDDVVAAEYKTPTLRVVGPATPVGYAALILGILLVLAIVAAIVVGVIIRRRQLQEVRGIIEDAIRDLLAGSEYAGTIFLAYRRLSAHLARHGFAEKASETPREFAIGVRKALPVSATPLRELIRLFEEAKYSDHAVGTRERDGAVENLSMVRAELDRLIGKKGAALA